MYIKYDIDIDNSAIINNLDRITNQIFKLLPCREEGGEWETTLSNLILEIGGMSNLLENQTELFSLLCKMEGLLILKDEEDFFKFRKGIFECLGLVKKVKECLV